MTSFRTGLEGSRDYTLGGQLSLTPSIEAGLLSTVIQLSPTCGHRKIPHTLVNRSSTSMPVDACGQAVCGLSKSPWARITAWAGLIAARDRT